MFGGFILSSFIFTVICINPNTRCTLHHYIMFDNGYHCAAGFDYSEMCSYWPHKVAEREVEEAVAVSCPCRASEAN